MKCRYCGKKITNIDEFYNHQDLCRRKKYIKHISEVLKIDLIQIFGTRDLDKADVNKNYNNFLYVAYLKSMNKKSLNEVDKEGLNAIYRLVLEPKLKNKKGEN